MKEFSFIEQLLKPLAHHPGAQALTDDVAFLPPLDPQHQWVITKDMLSAGTHFFAEDPPQHIARKALRVNLSDLAAKGATPFGYFLGLAIPSSLSASWLEAFVQGLASDQSLYHLHLLGGDTITHSADSLVISVTMIGKANAHFPKRSQAQIGDKVFVTGYLGEAALGLSLLKGHFNSISEASAFHLKERYYFPQPRLALASQISPYVHAMMDISDGLIQDAEHIAKASQVNIALLHSSLPLSFASKEILSQFPEAAELIYAGGDDYELLFTCKEEAIFPITEAARLLSVPLTEIGKVDMLTEKTNPQVTLYDDNNTPLFLRKKGYEHLL